MARLYADLAAGEPDRIKVVDRAGRCEPDILAEMEACCRALLERKAPAP